MHYSVGAGEKYGDYCVSCVVFSLPQKQRFPQPYPDDRELSIPEECRAGRHYDFSNTVEERRLI
jgi:hypothetical protein